MIISIGIVCLLSISLVSAADNIADNSVSVRETTSEQLMAHVSDGLDNNVTVEVNSNDCYSLVKVEGINEKNIIDEYDGNEIKETNISQIKHGQKTEILSASNILNDVLTDEFDWQYVGDATTTGFGTNIPIYVSESGSGFVLKDNLFNYQRFFSKGSDGNYYPNCYAENYLLPNIFKMDDSTYILTQGPGDSWYYKKLTYSKPKYSSIIVEDYDFQKFDYPFIGSGNQYSSVSIPVQVLDSNGNGVNGGIVVTDSLGNQVGNSYVTNGFTTVDISLSMSGKNKYDIQFNSANDNVESCSGSFYITSREQKVYVFLEGINNDDVITVKANSIVRFNVTTLGASSGAMCFMWRYSNGRQVYALDSRNPVYQIYSYYHPNCLFEAPEEAGSYILTISYGFGSAAHDFDFRSSRSYKVNVVDFKDTIIGAPSKVIANIGSNISFYISVSERIMVYPEYNPDDPVGSLGYSVTRSVGGGYISTMFNGEEYQFPVIDGVAKIDLFADGSFGSKSIKFNYKRSVIDFTECSKSVYLDMQPCNLDLTYDNIVLNPNLLYNFNVDVLANDFKINGSKLILEFIDNKTGNVSKSYSSKISHGKVNFTNIEFPKDIRDCTYRFTFSGFPVNNNIHYLKVYDSRIYTLKSYSCDENNISITSVKGEYGENTTVKIRVTDEFNDVNNNSVKLVVGSKKYVSLIENNESVFNFKNEYVKNDTIFAYYVVDGIEFPICNLDYVVNGNSSINVSAENIVHGETAKVTITSNVEGDVIIRVGTVEKTIHIFKSGVANFNDLDAKNDEYYVEAFFYPTNTNYRSSVGSTRFNVSKAEPNFSLDIGDRYYNQRAWLSVVFKRDLTGSAKICVYDANGNVCEYFNTNLSGGNINKYFYNLNVSNYIVTFEYGGDHNYNPINLNTTFNVLKIDPTITVNVINATYGGTAKIIVSSNAEGNATISVDSIKTYDNLIINDNLIIQNVTGLDVGTYSVSVNYNGNNNYNVKTYTSKLAISKASSTINIVSINNTVYLQNTTLYIKSSVDGCVVITIDPSSKKSYTKEVNVMADITVPVVFKNLLSGTHEVSIKLNPTSKNFNSSSDYRKFNISKKDTFVNLNITEFSYGQKVIIPVTASENGKVTLKVGKISRVKNVLANISTNFDFGVLPANMYNVSLSFNAGTNYNSVNTQSTLNVFHIMPDFYFYVSPYKSANDWVLIKVKSNISGIFNCEIGDFNKTINLSANTSKSMYLPYFEVGVHELHYTFAGDDVNYIQLKNSTSFSIYPVFTNVKLNVENQNYGNNVTVNVTANQSGKITMQFGNIIKIINVHPNKVYSVDFGIQDVGSYNINAKFVPTNYRLENSFDNATLVIIPKKSNIVDIQPLEYTYGKNVMLNVKTDADGTLTVKLGDKTQSKRATAGNVVLFDFGICDANNYDVKINLDAGTNYVPSQKTTSITVAPKSTSITLNTKNYNVGDKVIVNVIASEKGSVTIKLGIIVKTVNVNPNAISSIDFGILDVGLYNVIANFTGGNNYIDSTATGSVKVLSKIKDEDVNITIPEIKANQENNIVINLPADATGLVTLTIGNNSYSFTVKDGVADIKVPKLADGNYGYKINYSGDNKYASFENTGSIDVAKPTPEIVIPPLNEPSSDGSVAISLPSDATGTVTLVINGKPYSFSVVNGVANVYMPELEDGNYAYTVTYSGDGKYGSFTQFGSLSIINPKITASNVKVTYSAGSYYTIKVNGTDGKPANGASVGITVNGKTFKTLTTTNGVAKFKVTNVPGTYKMTINALGKSIIRTLTVKHLVTLKSVTVKKSAKKLTLQATLGKVNGKYLKNKKITFKFNGKKYTAKTNKKGVAKVTIKSSVLKKLNVGKKVTYQATYSKDTVKKTVKVKK